ncbi:MAG TPA: hypothetical protein EYH12_03885 [Psychromonas hadalis]|nr:hypothetical protein [Psychromonas hadalis]
MKIHIKLAFALLIAWFPINKVRCFLYRILFNYKIERSFIGWGTVISVAKAELLECSIGRSCKFIGPMTITIRKGSVIGSNNTFKCGVWATEGRFKSENYDCNLDIGEKTLITTHHYFDVVGSFVLGHSSWIAGKGSQFWTHGAGSMDHTITIGEHCYIGSAVRFAPGSSVGDNCIVGLGSILVKKSNTKNAIIAGNPAKVIRENFDWETKEYIS